MIIPCHDCFAFHADLSVVDPDLDVRQGQPDAVFLAVFVSVDRNHGGTLRDPVPVQYLYPEVCQSVDVSLIQKRPAADNLLKFSSERRKNRVKQPSADVDPAAPQKAAEREQTFQRFLFSFLAGGFPDIFVHGFDIERNQNQVLRPVFFELIAEMAQAPADINGIAVHQLSKYTDGEAKCMMEGQRKN